MLSETRRHRLLCFYSAPLLLLSLTGIRARLGSNFSSLLLLLGWRWKLRRSGGGWSFVSHLLPSLFPPASARTHAIGVIDLKYYQPYLVGVLRSSEGVDLLFNCCFSLFWSQWRSSWQTGSRKKRKILKMHWHSGWEGTREDGGRWSIVEKQKEIAGNEKSVRIWTEEKKKEQWMNEWKIKKKWGGKIEWKKCLRMV